LAVGGLGRRRVYRPQALQGNDNIDGVTALLAAKDEGIAALVKAEDDMQVVAEAGDGAEAIEKFRLHRPDVTLIDLEMPSLNGIEAINQIRGEFPETRIIILTTYTGDAKVVRALKAGARAYVLPIRALVFLRQ